MAKLGIRHSRYPGTWPANTGDGFRSCTKSTGFNIFSVIPQLLLFKVYFQICFDFTLIDRARQMHIIKQTVIEGKLFTDSYVKFLLSHNNLLDLVSMCQFISRIIIQLGMNSIMSGVTKKSLYLCWCFVLQFIIVLGSEFIHVLCKSLAQAKNINQIIFSQNFHKFNFSIFIFVKFQFLIC